MQKVPVHDWMTIFCIIFFVGEKIISVNNIKEEFHAKKNAFVLFGSIFVTAFATESSIRLL